jgi:hypothetical protein
MTLHAAALFTRRRFALVVARLVLDFIAAFVLLRPCVAAWALITQAPLSPQAWAGAVAFVLIGATASFLVRLCARAGTFRVAFALAAGRPARGVFVEGATAFAPAFSAYAGTAALELLAFGSAALALVIAPRVASHGAGGVIVAAGVGAAVLTVAMAASGLATLAFALAVIDDCGFNAAWTRLRIVAALERVSVRTVAVGLTLWGLGAAAGTVEMISAAAAWSLPEASTWTLLVPLLIAFYSVLTDTAAALFVAALTDRLPVGIAARTAVA